MLKRIFLPTILALLVYALWASPNFKVIAAGVAIFLFGMLSLEDGFRAFTGGLLERILKKTTNSMPKSVGFGIVTTTIMQSSSLVSVITISFLSAGLLGLASGIGIIFGANIGTTTGAWLLAGFGLKIKLSVYAMPMLVIGILFVFQRGRTIKGIGHVLAGLGFLFLGIHYMKDGFEAYRASIDLASYAIPGFGGLVVFTLIGVAATVIMQSSHATLVLIITALASGQITYDNALALAIGANIGTTITAILGSLTANHEGKRLAGAHLIFNVTTGLVAIIFIKQFRLVVDTVAEWIGIAADNHTLKLAVFHTIFNLVGVAIMLPFVGRLVRLLERTFKAPEADISRPRFLADSVMEFPETLAEAVRNETLHLYDNAVEVIAHGLNLRRTDIFSDTPLEQVVAKSRKVMEFDLDAQYIAKIKALYSQILEFTTRAQDQQPADALERVFDLRNACRLVVAAVKDVKHLRKNVVQHLNAENPVVRDMYDAFRVQAASVLRDIQALRDDDPDVDVFDLDTHRASVAESNLATSGALDILMRQGALTGDASTSLINDQIYVRDIVSHLVEFGFNLFGSADAMERGLQQAMTLEDDDIDWLVDQSVGD